MNYDGMGTLTVRAYTAGGAFPVSGALVRIKAANTENNVAERSAVTDLDGMARRISLPAPSRSFSEAPGSLEIPYASYNIEISADGYYAKQIMNVAVFDGVDAMLPVNMIPFIPYSEGGRYPQGNINSVVGENENLY